MDKKYGQTHMIFSTYSYYSTCTLLLHYCIANLVRQKNVFSADGSDTVLSLEETRTGTAAGHAQPPHTASNSDADHVLHVCRQAA